MKIDKQIKAVAKRLDNITANGNSGNGHNNDSIKAYYTVIKDDDYYLDIGEDPPRFLYYRQVRAEKWKASGHNSFDYDSSITQDEINYALKRYLRMTPEQRYQHEKENMIFHELYYLDQKIDDRGICVDIVKGYGCGHPDNSFVGCVPECRYYNENGRIEDEEVIEKYRELEESHRQKNDLVDIELPYEDTLKEFLIEFYNKRFEHR